MSLINMDYILIISQGNELVETLNHICKRLGTQKIRHCTRLSQALAFLQEAPLPNLIIQHLKIIDKEHFFPNIQQNNLKKNLNKAPIPVPVFAIISPSTKKDLEEIRNSNYIGYELTPINETLLEQKIRELYYESYSYDEGNALKEVVEQHIAHKNFKLAYRDLLPVLCLKPKNINYLLLYSIILFEKMEYDLAECVLKYILTQEVDNLKAKNLLTKILIVTKRYEEVVL